MSTVDASPETKLAMCFVELSQHRAACAALEATIEQLILASPKPASASIAGIKATYYKETHETPDYEAIVADKLPEDFDLTPYTTVTKKVSWKSVAEKLEIEIPETSVVPARVVVK